MLKPLSKQSLKRGPEAQFNATGSLEIYINCLIHLLKIIHHHISVKNNNSIHDKVGMTSDCAGSKITDDETISIPRNSFTAFRALYGDFEEISHVSKVVLLGSIPKLWYKEQSSSLLRNFTKASYTKFEKTIKNFGGVLNSGYRFGYGGTREQNIKKFLFLTNQDVETETDLTSLDEFDDYEDEEEEEDDDDYPVNSGPIATKHFLPKAISENRDQSAARELENRDKNHTSNNIHSSKQTPDYSRALKDHPNQPSTSQSSIPRINVEEELPVSPKVNNLTKPLMQLPDSTSQTFYSAVETIPSHDSGEPEEVVPEQTTSTEDNSLGTKLVTTPSNSSNRVSPYPAETTPLGSEDVHNQLSIPQTKPRNLSIVSNTTQRSSASTVEGSRVSFASTTGSRRTGSTAFLRPEPEENPIILPLDPRHERALDRIKAVASRTKKHVKNDLKTINQKRTFHKLLKNFKVGEIIKVEKMLVLVKCKVNADTLIHSTFTEVEPCDTRILEQWKEYMVVARTTGDINEPILIQFYTKREIPHNETTKHSDDELDFTVSKSCVLNFYSSLDKTIAIVKRQKVYILRSQTPQTAVRWLTFLNETIGNGNPGRLMIQIPRLAISLNIKITKKLFNVLLDEEETKSTTLVFKDNGYVLKESPIMEYLAQKIKTKLAKVGYQETVNHWNSQNMVLAFCWRHYDRLEWIFGESLMELFWQQSMYSTHDLELRLSQHYPKEVTKEGITWKEPAAIEGFLARLSNRRGTNRNTVHKQIFKFSYFHSDNNLLFFSRSYKALPPIPGHEFLSHPDFLSNPEHFDEVVANVPQIYNHNTYELNDKGHVSWLTPGLSMEEFEKRDKFANYEYERRVASVLRADAVINLLDVNEVKEVSWSSLPTAVRAADNYAWGQSVDLRNESDESKDSFFQLHLKNGVSFTLKAPSKFIRDEWIRRLNELVHYWKLRIDEDVERVYDIKLKNIARLNINDYMEANVGEATPKWENSRGIADPSIHNISSNAMFRPVIRSGMLYQKPKKHTVFKNYFVCLIPGFIILYKVHVRGPFGITLKTSHYMHYLTIPLSECYVYSGNTSGLDLLDRESEINDNVNLDRNTLPRIYKDGWNSSEDEASRCFTLWFGTKRAIAGKLKKETNTGHENFNDYGSKNPGLIKMVSRLGVTGRSVVFMCRSRQERDLWVNNIYTEVERFQIPEEESASH